jgi:hypothetical protein
MRRIWNGFIWLLLLAGFPLLAWAGISMAWETYSFWRYGVEKSAHVVALDHTSSAGKGGTTFYYAIEMDGRKSVESFRVRLPVGGDIGVLTLPDDPTRLTPGTRRSSAFEIFAYSIGGPVMAVLVITMYVFLIFAGPKALVAVIKLRREVFDMK